MRAIIARSKVDNMKGERRSSLLAHSTLSLSTLSTAVQFELRSAEKREKKHKERPNKQISWQIANPEAEKKIPLFVFSLISD
jgi:hypothetical protein